MIKSQPTLAATTDLLDLIKILVWYLYLLYLYKRSGVASRAQLWSFAAIAGSVFVVGIITALTFDGSVSYTLFSVPIATRLLVCISELLLIENLYLNLPQNARWHIALPCVLLGGIACLETLYIADSALFGRPSVSIASGRTITMIVIAPLLVLAALRGQRWSEPIRLSRAAVFHSATLVLSGSVLLALALTGEILRHLDDKWGWVAEISLMFSGMIGLLLLLSSRSARSIMDRLVVHHFFADRFDYRIQWLNCIGTLSGRGSNERTDLYTRVIRAVADVVNSPNGALFIRNDLENSLTWTGSWNMPAVQDLSLSHQFVQEIFQKCQTLDLQRAGANLIPLLSRLGPIWLCVPLLNSDGLTGMVVVGPPRTEFRVDQEVSDLLDILGQEVGTYLAEQRATEVVTQTRGLHDYAKRFAFVAHDIKNVSSQLALLLRNAEHYIDNPDFQRDMLGTVRSSVSKIDHLLKRLDKNSSDNPQVFFAPVPRLTMLLRDYLNLPGIDLVLKHDSLSGQIAINSEAFDTIVTHLLNNAGEAPHTRVISVVVKHAPEQVVIDVTDDGEGMSPEFVRDELFSLFKSKKEFGSGIGAFQARELIREAGGELLVISQQGVGTTMRMIFRSANKLQFGWPGELMLQSTGS